ncbi:MAG: PQQ-binding-like beta-propeller repeat protein [Thermodesulfobacteriota bacterium]
MDTNEILYVGIKAQVLALDRQTGNVIWRTALPRWNLAGDTFVNVVFDNGSIFAHTMGRLFCLDPETGHIKWRNNLAGCGYGIAAFATSNSSTANVALVQRIKEVARSAKYAIIPIWLAVFAQFLFK